MLYMSEMSFPEMLLLRKKLNMPQVDVAYYLGIKNRLLISQWESGFRKPTEPMRRLIKYLNSLPSTGAKRILMELQKHES